MARGANPNQGEYDSAQRRIRPRRQSLFRGGPLPREERRAIRDKLDGLVARGDINGLSSSFDEHQRAEVELFVGRELDFAVVSADRAVAWIVERLEALRHYGPGEVGRTAVRVAALAEEFRMLHKEHRVRHGYSVPVATFAPLAWEKFPHERLLDFVFEANEIFFDSYLDQPAEEIAARLVALRDSMI